MGLGIAVGPLLLVVFGVDSAVPYYVCAAIVLISCKTGQLACGLMLLVGTVAIPFSQPVPWLTTLMVFLWGGAIGGMNTLAVIEAGDRVATHQVSTAMTAIAMFYTLGSVLGPVATGATISFVSAHDLMIAWEASVLSSLRYWF